MSSAAGDGSPPAPRSGLPHVFRRIFQGLYALLLLGFFATIAFSATYGAFHRPEPADAVMPEDDVRVDGPAGEACRARLRAHFEALETAADRMLAGVHRPDAAEAWQRWSDAFRARLSTARRACRLDRPQLAPLALLADDIERHRLGYETALLALTRVAGEPRARLMQSFPEIDASGGEPPEDGR